jgi:hypothetical protein
VFSDIIILFQFGLVYRVSGKAPVCATELNLHRKCRIASRARNFYAAVLKHPGKASGVPMRTDISGPSLLTKGSWRLLRLEFVSAEN